MPATTAKNLVKYDVSGCWITEITEGADGSITYGTPFKENGVISVSLDAEGDTSTLRADGRAYKTTISNNGYTGEIEFAMVSDDFRTKILGESLDANKVLTESDEDNIKPFGMILEFKGDKKKIRHVFYYCLAGRPSVEGENPDNKEAQSESMDLTCLPRPSDGKIKSKTTDGTSDDVFNALIATVYTGEPVV